MEVLRQTDVGGQFSIETETEGGKINFNLNNK
jgi:hypothetical protein